LEQSGNTTMASNIAKPVRQTIALTDTESGWVFRLHNDDHRVWLDSYPTDAPVPVAFIAGEKAGEFETVIGNSRDVEEMASAARRMLPPRITISRLDAFLAAA
jgi:hypothetical protein